MSVFAIGPGKWAWTRGSSRRSPQHAPSSIGRLCDRSETQGSIGGSRPPMSSSG
jgi:hypothetical protein